MKKIVFDECPYCGSKMLVYGYQTDSGSVYTDVRGGVFGSPVEHTICQECGSIVYSRILRPDIYKEYVDPANKEIAKKELEKKANKKPKKEGILEIIVDDDQPENK